MSNRLTVIVLGALSVAVAALRLLPHAPNIAALSALFLVSGFYGRGLWRYALPFGALVVSDYTLGWYDWRVMAAVYLCYTFNIGLGYLWTKSKVRQGWRLPALLTTSLLGSVIFYLVTNAAVVLFSRLYPANFAGLLQSYLNALPFFRNSLISDLWATVILVGVIEAVPLLWRPVTAAINRIKLRFS